MSIRNRLFIAFFILAVLPLLIVGSTSLRNMQGANNLIVDEGTQNMKNLGETSIRQKALDVAQQISLYLEAHPNLAQDPEKMMADQELAGLAVQPVGKTGYTALYTSKGITLFHSNPNLVNKDMHTFAATLPEFWAIFDKSLDGTVVGSYYVWKDADGVLRDKYMECVPVGGTEFRIAATTYIDEFYAPIRSTQQKADAIYVNTVIQSIAALVLVAALAVFVALWLSSNISKPIVELISASKAVEAEQFSSINLTDVEKREDELGGLARVFSKMIQQVEHREKNLKQEVHELQVQVKLYIKIDEERRERQVREITETEYFEVLKEKAGELRREKKK